MNYLAELKAFYDKLELNPQPNTVIALWHALMSIANKAGWPDTFTVASSVLGLRSGLNASALKRARNKLATDGFIDWKPRGGNQSAQYHIKSLVVQNRHENEPQYEPQSEPQSEPQCEPQSEPQSEPINKHKLKPKHNNPPISPAEHFDDFWNAYPKRGNRSLTEKAYVDVLLSNVPEEDVLAAVRNYAEAVRIQDTQERYIKNPDRFLTDNTFLDYLPGKYRKPNKPATVGKNRFNDFQQRDYDYEELEKRLLGK